MRFLRSYLALVIVFLAGPIGAGLTIYGFVVGGKAVPLWAGLVCIVCAVAAATFHAIAKKDKEVGNVRAAMLEQRNEFLEVIAGLKKELVRQEETNTAHRSHYEVELALLKDAVGTPSITLGIKEETEHDASGRDRAQGRGSIRNRLEEGPFFLTNTGRTEATNIAVSDIVVPMAQHHINSVRETYEAFPIAEPDNETEWHVHFSPIRDLAYGEKTDLSFRIENASSLTPIEYIFENADGIVGPDYVFSCPVVIDYSGKDRRWRRTYKLQYSVPGHRLWLTHQSIEELSARSS